MKFKYLLPLVLWSGGFADAAQSLVVIGTPGAGGGDTLNVAFGKLNANDTELYSSLSSVRTVATGGTGATTLTGIIKGNGTSAFTAAVAGTDYVIPSGTVANATNATNASTVTTNANLTGDVTSVGNATAIATGAIVNADINASAAIAFSKIANPTTAAGYSIVNGANIDLWGTVTAGTGINTFLTTPSSANLSAALTNETGTGVVVFNISPALTTPALSGPTITNATYPVSAQSGTVLDFSGDPYKTYTLAANTTFTTSNLAAGKSLTVRITGGASLWTTTFPAWTFVGSTAPANVAIGKVGILTITSFGTTDANCVAAFSVQP